MRVIVCENYDEMSLKAAEFVKAVVTLKPDCILGLATGSTPIGTYENIIKMKLDMSEVRTFNLDEYYPIKKSNDQSYDYFMNDNLFSKVNIKKENIDIPNGEVADPEAECKRYEAKIAQTGKIDIQILGIGPNGHIGFNEPDSYLQAHTHLTGLTDSTIEANKRFFEKKEDVPTKALTMGVSTIMNAKTIILLASGAGKKDAVAKLLSNKVTPEVPASVLCMHSDTIIICDKEAYPF